MKQPRKIQDPTEAALSAIQEALTLQLDNTETAASHEDRTTQPGREPRQRRSRVEVAERRAANDDRQTIGQLLSQLQRRSSPAPYWWAGGLAILWLGFGAPYAISAVRASAPGLGSLDALMASPALMAILGSLLIPPVAFFALPPWCAARGTAAHRQVHDRGGAAPRTAGIPWHRCGRHRRPGRAPGSRAMGEGLDRAIARAAELETVVRNEVSILERAYEDNEIRIRSLISELHAENAKASSPTRSACAKASSTRRPCSPARCVRPQTACRTMCPPRWSA